MSDWFEKALLDEGVLGTPLESIARKTRGYESGGNPNAVSNRGARGGMQVMPGTFNDVADAGWNIGDDYHNSRAGIRYLKQGWDKSGGDVALTGAYYYGGPGGMNKAKQGIAVSDPVNPNFPNTLEYGNRLANSVNKGSNMNSSLPLTTGNKFEGVEEYMNQANALMPQVNPSPELTAMLHKNMQRRSSNLPLAIGSMLSRDRGVQNFGDTVYDDANDAMNPLALGDEGFIDPESGQFIASPIGETRRKESVLKMSMNAMQRNKAPDPYYTPIPTTGGIASFDNRTGTTSLARDSSGNPIIPFVADPNGQGAVAGAKEGAKVTAEFNANKKVNAPKALKDAQYTVDLVTDLIKHPGRELATGKSRMFGIQNIDGTDAKSFDIALEQIRGQQFLEAFQSLKGGGAITQIEGETATKALSRMNAANTEEEFSKAAEEFQQIMQKAAVQAKNLIDGSGQTPEPSPGNPEPPRALSPDEQREYDELQAWSANR